MFLLRFNQKLLNLFKIKKWPSKNQWSQFFKILTKPERIAFLALSIVFLTSACFLSFKFYISHTIEAPTYGGVHVEGIIGQPRFINPIYSPLNDIDEDLTELLFRGLVKYTKDGDIIPDIAQKFEPKEGGRIFEFYLKENIIWEDKEPITVDDVIFTIKTIQDPDYKSPLRASWLGVEIEKISDHRIQFKLQKPYQGFLGNCAVKILPKHIWENVSAQNFPLATELNLLNPIGSGPYSLTQIQQTKENFTESLTLSPSQTYSEEKPYLSKIIFRFFKKEEDLLAAAQNGEIKGFSLSSAEHLKDFTEKTFQLYSLKMPRYFAVFFNPEKTDILKNKKIREAFNYGTNKNEMIEKLLFGYGETVDSPMLGNIYNLDSPKKIYEFDIEKAKTILEEEGFLEQEGGKRVKTIKQEAEFQFEKELKVNSRGENVNELQKCLAKDTEIYPDGEITGFFGRLTKKAVIKFQEKYSEDILEPLGLKEGTGKVGESTRAKLNEICFESKKESLPLTLSLTTSNEPLLIRTAEILKEQWELLGAEIEIKIFDLSELEQDVIKPRNYEALLFGEALGMIPDPLPFWHSSQKNHPGLNLALYSNIEVDKLLEENRQILDESLRKEKYEEFQDLLINDAPCVFLYNSDYLYLISNEIQGVNVNLIPASAKRFGGIEEWYAETKRVWK